MSESTHLPPADYEPRDASPRRLLIVAGGLALGIFLSLGISLALYAWRYHDAPRPGAIGRQTSFRHSPTAQPDMLADWGRQDEAVRTHLDQYGWIDRTAGVVRIPIGRAMQRLVDEAKEEKGAAK